MEARRSRGDRFYGPLLGGAPRAVLGRRRRDAQQTDACKHDARAQRLGQAGGDMRLRRSARSSRNHIAPQDCARTRLPRSATLPHARLYGLNLVQDHPGDACVIRRTAHGSYGASSQSHSFGIRNT